MKILIGEQAREDIAWWNRHDKTKTLRIRALIESILQTPFEGIGKPEPLKYDLQGHWSRRIDRTHRLIYRVTDDAVVVISCRFHYQ
ncbi:Txe/YoeB family addiction module toxin [Desulfosarcina sp. OttesenSCG-928-A07]|nr:Txe/YoeB family addiction module toxin [Desulfosarcina sp. OttesenSCG-928-A07]